MPIRERIAAVQLQIKGLETQRVEMSNARLPAAAEISAFAKKVESKLQVLNFQLKQAIIRGVLERVVGTPIQLQVVGFLPIDISNTLDYVASCSKHRHRRTPQRRQVNSF